MKTCYYRVVDAMRREGMATRKVLDILNDRSRSVNGKLRKAEIGQKRYKKKLWIQSFNINVHNTFLGIDYLEARGIVILIGS